jgi:hypothetical protein
MTEYEEQPQQQPQQYPQSFQSPINNLGSTVLILTNPEDDLYKTELMIRGLEEDRRTGQLIQRTQPLMNDTGANIIIGMAQDFMSRNCNMSNLEDMREVDALRNHFQDNMIELLMTNRTKFGIKDQSSMSIITGKLVIEAHLSLKRAYLEGDKRFLKSSHHEVTQKIDAPNRQKSGWMSWLTPGN